MPKKMLVVCYSWTNGNTEDRRAARRHLRCWHRAHRDRGPYPEDYDETVEQGRREIDEGFEPEIEPLEHAVDAWIARVSK